MIATWSVIFNALFSFGSATFVPFNIDDKLPDPYLQPEVVKVPQQEMATKETWLQPMEYPGRFIIKDEHFKS